MTRIGKSETYVPHFSHVTFDRNGQMKHISRRVSHRTPSPCFSRDSNCTINVKEVEHDRGYVMGGETEISVRRSVFAYNAPRCVGQTMLDRPFFFFFFFSLVRTRTRQVERTAACSWWRNVNHISK